MSQIFINRKDTNFGDIMNILDIIIIICSIPVLLNGYRKGFIRQAISLFALLIGIWIASGLGDNVGAWIQPALEGKCDHPDKIAGIIGLAIVFVIVLASLGIIGRIVEKFIQLVVPETVNKWLGVALSAANMLLTLCVLYLIFLALNKVFFLFDLRSALFADSLIYPVIESLTDTIVPNIHKLLL